MKRRDHSRAFVAVLTAGAALAFLLSAGQVKAADRAPGPEATRAASTSQHVNSHADQHADYRANGTEDPAKGTEDDSAPRRDGRPDFQRDFTRDWRHTLGIGHGLGWPR